MTRRPGLIDATVEELRSRIVSGQWPVGARIPTEPVLVEMLGVGRNTVREAVQALVHSGLVERRQGSGTYVLGTSELAVTMGRQIADARQRDVVEVRRALEVEAARLAAHRHTADEATAIVSARDQRTAAYLSGDLDTMVATDLTLHRAIVRASGNPVLIDLYDNLIDAIGENIRFNFVTDGDAHGVAAHDALIAAIVGRDAPGAGRETADYLSALLDEPEG